MFYKKIILLMALLAVFSGCNSNSSEVEAIITDKVLLSCFETIPDKGKINSMTEFSCHDVDLSAADVSQLGNLKLKKLTLNGTKLNNLDFLHSMKGLEYFSFRNNYNRDTNNVAIFESLIPVSLRLSPIAGNVNLRFLDLSENYIADFSDLSGLKKLEELYLNKVYGDGIGHYILDLGPISFEGLGNLINLKTIELSNNYLLSGDPYPMSYNFLSNLTKLEKLVLKKSFIDGDKFNGSVDFFKNLKNLQYLDLSKNQFNSYGDLAGTIRNVDFLSGLEKIKYLNLGDNIITDSSSIASLENLEYLNLNNNSYDSKAVEFGGAESTNSIGNLSFVSNLIKLTDLRLANTTISNSDVSYLSSLTALKYLDLRHNNITDISPISSIAIDELYY